MMNKKQEEQRRREEDRALMLSLLWVAGTVVLEVLLFLVNRYAFDFDATAQGVAIAESMRAGLRVMRILGGVLIPAGAILALLRSKKNEKTGWFAAMSVIGAVVMMCAHVSLLYQSSGLRMLYLLVAMLGGLAVSYYIYQHDFVLAALPVVLAVLGLWLIRLGGFGAEVLASMLLCAAVLIAVLKLKKNDGVLKNLRFLPEKTEYTIPMISCVIAVAAQAVAAVAGAVLAYYLIFAMGAWLFALLVYYTVKML